MAGMPDALLGEQVTIYLTPPERPLGYFLLLASLLLLGYVVYQYREAWERMKSRHWLVAAGLSLLAVAATLAAGSLPVGSSLNPAAATSPFRAIWTPFGSIAWLAAAATLNPIAAILVGFITGLARALFQTHNLLTPFAFAFIALLSHLLLQRHFVGRVYEALRYPLVNALTMMVFMMPLVALTAYVNAAASVTFYSALDIAFATTSANFLSLFVEGLIAGAVITVALATVPQWRPSLPAPLNLRWQQHISTTLVRQFVIFSLVLTVIAALVATLRSITVARELVATQMGQAAERVEERVEQYLQLRQDVLVAYRQNERLTNEDLTDDDAVLRQLFDSGDLFTATLLVGADGTVQASEPDNLMLTAWEQASFIQALSTQQTVISPAQLGSMSGDPYIISFIVPVLANNTALIGRVNQTDLDRIAAAPGTIGETLIADASRTIIADPEGAKHGQPLELAPRNDVTQPNDAAASNEVQDQWDATTNARHLIYRHDVEAQGQQWEIIITTSYDRVLQQALPVGGVLALVLPLPLMAYAYHLVRQGRRIAQPITNLSQVARQISQGSLDTIIPVVRDDEVGQLAHSFEQMRRSLKKRLDELSLLLSVSQNVSTSMDITSSLQVIISSGLQAAKADGARIIMSNPGGRQPLQFGEGPVAELMAPYDRTMMRLANQQQNGVLILRSRQQIRATFSAERPMNTDLPLAALIAVPMHARDRYRGVFWLGYTEPHEFSQLEINFLTTLAGQASVVAENTLLFANAEGGRRRLLAVLSSTTDAVIVTDQTDRVILVNPAMEKAFDLKGSVSYRRQVKDVLKDPVLLEAMLKKATRPQSFEITAPDHHIYLASVASIRGDRDELLGRVAVLHDITTMKELDEMKTELVRTVSHDLRGPLAYMRGYATMLPTVGEINDKQHYYLSKIVTGVDQMTSLVEGILSLRRLESGTGIVLEEVRPEQLLESVAQLHEQEAEQSGLHLVTDIPANLPLVQVDRSLIQQALSNLVGNAIKYAKDSGPLILSASANHAELIFSVQDHGPGIAADNIPRLFDEFYRVQHRGAEHIKGSGLGLALVRSIAKRHGGRAWCQSKLGEGSTFYVSVPLNGHIPN